MKLIRPLLAITLVAFAAAPLARADDSAVKAKIKEMEDAWSKAQMDKDHGVAVIGAMVAEDFAGVTSKGEASTKASMLEKMKAETDTYTASMNDSVEVHVYGSNVATACGRSTEKGKDKDGKEFNRSYAWVDTWMERNGKWECIAGSGMLLPEKK